MKSSRALRASVPVSEPPIQLRSADVVAMPIGAAKSRTRSLIADYVALIKPRIMVLLLITTLAAVLIAASARPPSGLETVRLVVLTLLGGVLAAGGASALNQYFDRDIDALMARTRNRPLPAGRLTPRAVLVFGLALTVASVLVFGLGVNYLSAALALGGSLFYVVVYTLWLKRLTPQNIVIGGIAGAIPPLVGWSAVRNDIELPGILLFVIITLWTPPHFWSLSLLTRRDYTRAGIPMLPVVRGLNQTCLNILAYTLVLVASTLLLYFTGAMGTLYLIVAAVLGLAFIIQAGALLKNGTQMRAKSLFIYSNIYLALLFAGMVADRLVVLS